MPLSIERPEEGEESNEPAPIIYKTIMCPLKEECPKVKNGRWPTSQTKAVVQRGRDCPYAHHPMELCFPEQLFTKYSSNNIFLNKIKKSHSSKQIKTPFYPSGPLFDCGNQTFQYT